MTDLFARASTVTDERSFVAFLAELAKDRAASMRAEAASPSSPTGPTSRGWENVELSSFLEAAASWAEATASGTRAYHPPSNPWQRAAQIICAGKFYEQLKPNYVLQRTPGTFLVSSRLRGPAPLNTALGNRVQRVQIHHLSEHAHMLPALAELHLVEWGREGESREARIERIRSVVGHPRSVPSVFVALVGGELVGSVALLERDALRGDLGPWLAGLFVRPERRGMGIGRELARRAVAEAALVGADTLHLACDPELEGYYALLGWQRVGSSSDLVVMSHWAVA